MLDKQRGAINLALYKLGCSYHVGLPIAYIESILLKNGGYNLETGIYCGESGRSLEPIFLDGKQTKYYLCVSWYKMSSGRYEIVAYVS